MVVQCISKCEANEFFHQYEHLGNCGLGVWHYGCFIDGIVTAVISFGTVCFNPKRSRIGQFALDNNLKMIQLARGGTRFDAPKNSPSQAVSLVLKALRDKQGDAIVVAYSDMKWNEIGTIYQASNFLYLGMTNPRGQANYVINGEEMSGWTVRKRYGTRNMIQLKSIAGNVERIPLTPKHRYIFINAGSKMKSKASFALRDMIQPYPTRAVYNVGSMLAIRESIIIPRI